MGGEAGEGGDTGHAERVESKYKYAKWGGKWWTEDPSHRRCSWERRRVPRSNSGRSSSWHWAKITHQPIPPTAHLALPPSAAQVSRPVSRGQINASQREGGQGDGERTERTERKQIQEARGNAKSFILGLWYCLDHRAHAKQEKARLLFSTHRPGLALFSLQRPLRKYIRPLHLRPRQKVKIGHGHGAGPACDPSYTYLTAIRLSVQIS